MRRHLYSCVLGGLIFAAGLSSPVACRAQVLEIGDTGAVKVYDRPMVFTAQGATPIMTPSRRSSRARTFFGRTITGREAIAEAAGAAALSPALVEAVAWRESGFRPGVVSHAGAVGEMQLMPATARRLGVDPRDSRQNYFGGAAYLSALMQRYDGDVVRTLAAYNAGPGAVDRYGGVPPFRETQAYIAAIMDRLSQQAAAVGKNGSGK